VDDVGNGCIETGNCVVDWVLGNQVPEPDGYTVPKIPESPSTTG